jgi:predicted small secreted protein
MRKIATLGLLASTMLLAACNTVHGAGEDIRSVGRVFSHDPNGDNQRSH